MPLSSDSDKDSKQARPACSNAPSLPRALPLPEDVSLQVSEWARFWGAPVKHDKWTTCSNFMGPFRELNPGPLAPEARIMPLDQTAIWNLFATRRKACTSQGEPHDKALCAPVADKSLRGRHSTAASEGGGISSPPWRAIPMHQRGKEGRLQCVWRPLLVETCQESTLGRACAAYR